VSTDNILRTLSDGGDLVYVEAGRVGRENRTRFGDCIELFEDLLL
jgi:hypothetical protein